MFTAASTLSPDRPAEASRIIFREVVGTCHAVLTLGGLLIVTEAGNVLQSRLGLPIPGPVLGIALLAAGLATLAFFAARFADAIHRASAPLARRLLTHMGLLFVPAGAGIVTAFPALKHAGLALAAGVTGSALIGVAVTYAAMQYLGSQPRAESVGQQC